MAVTQKKVSDKGGKRKRSRQWLIYGPLLGAAALAAAVGISMWRRVPSTGAVSSEDGTREPPSLEATDVDPAVMRSIRAARSAITQSPHAAERWGRLGMILKAH